MVYSCGVDIRTQYCENLYEHSGVNLCVSMTFHEKFRITVSRINYLTSYRPTHPGCKYIFPRLTFKRKVDSSCLENIQMREDSLQWNDAMWESHPTCVAPWPSVFVFSSWLHNRTTTTTTTVYSLLINLHPCICVCITIFIFESHKHVPIIYKTRDGSDPSRHG